MHNYFKIWTLPSLLNSNVLQKVSLENGQNRTKVFPWFEGFEIQKSIAKRQKSHTNGKTEKSAKVQTFVLIGKSIISIGYH